MRQRAKPFTVEIKKSRKSSNHAQPLFGLFDTKPAAQEAVASRASEIATDKLFGRPANSGGLRGHDDPDRSKVLQAGSVAWARETDSNGAVDPRPTANRILPDLTWRDHLKPEPDTQAPAAPRTRASRGPRKLAKAGGRRTEDQSADGPVVALTGAGTKPAPGREPIRRAMPAARLVRVSADQGAEQEAKPARRGRRLSRRAEIGEGASAAALPAGERWKRRLPRVCW
jgi:hypothetical protein